MQPEGVDGSKEMKSDNFPPSDREKDIIEKVLDEIFSGVEEEI